MQGRDELQTSNVKLTDADAPFDIVWDDIGIAHVYAETVADAYRGMGYAAGSERLWQIHLSTAYANGQAAHLLGERFVPQDAIQRACNVDGAQTGLIDSDGDWIADAYLQGLNGAIDHLQVLPPEFAHAGATPRHFTREDVAARYRFTSWFQHKSWTEKMVLGRLIATHGTEYFRNHVLHFSETDAALIETLRDPLRELATEALPLAYPDFSHSRISGSNNWAVSGALSASGKPMLATDPHQPHSIPNTFFYVHLHAGDWDAFGAAFPGVPYFMMGYTRDIAWGLTTGFIDCYDVYIEHLQNGKVRSADGWADLTRRNERIKIKGGRHQDIEICRTGHGPILEHLTDQLGLSEHGLEGFRTALHWSLADIPTSAGALARLPLARSAEQFGEYLFENDVCPLVNNIICVDQQDHIRRFIATTLPARVGATGSVPLPGWNAQFDFPHSTAADLVVETDPDCGFALTANNDTMEDRGKYYIHNFPTHSARADRIRDILQSQQRFTVEDFKRAQLDLKDVRASKLAPMLADILHESNDSDVQLAADLLDAWDYQATADAAAPCVYYPFLDRAWHRKFMRSVLDDALLNALPLGAPGLNLFDPGHFLIDGSPWLAHAQGLKATIHSVMKGVVADVRRSLGDQPAQWRWDVLHQIQFSHRLAGHDPWSRLQLGPDPIAGAPTTLGMAMHMGPGPGAESDDIPCRVFHGPAFRLVVDLADPEHAAFVIAGGNGGADSPHALDHYQTWLQGDFYQLRLIREELNPTSVVTVAP